MSLSLDSRDNWPKPAQAPSRSRVPSPSLVHRTGLLGSVQFLQGATGATCFTHSHTITKKPTQRTNTTQEPRKASKRDDHCEHIVSLRVGLGKVSDSEISRWEVAFQPPAEGRPGLRTGALPCLSGATWPPWWGGGSVGARAWGSGEAPAAPS